MPNEELGGISVKRCRICKNSDLSLYLDLGFTPLANQLVMQKDLNKKDRLFPLQVLFCNNCSLSQLSLVIDPKVLFSTYPYRSSISKTFQMHCAEFAENVAKRYGLSEKDLVVDIASNDGCLLNAFKKYNVQILGVDPATNIADIANKNGINTIAAFWDKKVAADISDKYGKASIITATNVFAHVDNLSEFVNNTSLLLKDEGYFIIEVPYLVNFIRNHEFDTVYHEHLSYFLIKPLTYLFDEFSMEIFDIEKLSIHGGSVRIFVKKKINTKTKISGNVQNFLKEEESNGFYSKEKYLDFSKQVKEMKESFITLLTTLKKESKKVIGYGASAKGNTLLNYYGVGPELIEFIIDDTPEKQNHYTPGKHIPIRSADILNKSNYDYMVILAWNFSNEIIAKTKQFKEKNGKYIIPIPNLKII